MSRPELAQKLQEAYLSGKLAIHAAEDQPDYEGIKVGGQPIIALREQWDIPIGETIATHGLPYSPSKLLSCSVLLPEAEGNLLAFGQAFPGVVVPIFFIDLTQRDPKTSSRAVIASPKDGNSGWFNRHKDTDAFEFTTPQLAALFEGLDKKGIFEVAADDELGPGRSDQMLEALQRSYEGAPSLGPLKQYKTNEVLVATKLENLEAVGITIWSANPETALRDEALAVLQGVTSYFELKQDWGVDLPLMAYDVNAAPGSTLTLLATTEEEVLEVAASALEQLSQEVPSKVGYRPLEQALAFGKVLKALDKGLELPPHKPSHDPIEYEDYSTEHPRGLVGEKGKYGSLASTEAPTKDATGPSRNDAMDFLREKGREQ